MLQRACTLLAADHGEVALVAVEPGHGHHTGFVEARGCCKDVARQRHGRAEDGVEFFHVALREFAEGGTGSRCNRVEDAQQRIALAVEPFAAETVTGDQLGVVEVVAGVHAHAGGQVAAHGDFLVLVKQRDLDAVDLVRVGVDDAQCGVHGLLNIAAAPVARQRRVEHLAQPVQHHRLSGLAQDAVVNTFVIGRAFCHAGQRAAGHDDQFAAQLFNRRHLFFVAGNHLVHGLHVLQHQVVGAATGSDERTGNVLRGFQRTADQFERGRPVQTHAALRRVHGLSHAQAQRPQVAAVGDGRIPIHGAVDPRIDHGQRVGHHVSGRIGDAVEGHTCGGLHRCAALQRVGLQAARGNRQGQGQSHQIHLFI